MQNKLIIKLFLIFSLVCNNSFAYTIFYYSYYDNLIINTNKINNNPITTNTTTITTNYDETTVANNLNANNINIRTGNNFNSVSTIINDTTIDTVDTLINLNNIKLDIGNGIGITVAEEKHEHEEVHDTWGGDIGRAALGGAITGLASGIGIKGGEFLGKLASGSIGNLVGQTTSKVVGSMVNASVASYSTSIGSAMANTTIYGGSFKDVMKSGWKSAGDKDTWKSVGISAGIAGLSTYLIETTNGTTSLDKAQNEAVYKPDEKILNEYKQINPDYNGVVDRTANNIGMANTTKNIDLVGKSVPPYSNNPLDKTFWQGLAKEGGAISKTANEIPGMNSMSLMHDFWSSTAITGTTPILQLTIVPAVAVQYCATFPSLCGGITTIETNKDIKK